MGKQIRGYRVLSAEETDIVNEIKAEGDVIAECLDLISKMDGVDQRALSIARTNLQTGMMWWVRAITRPEGF